MTAMQPWHRLHARVAGLGRWAGRMAALGLGVVAVFSMAPLYQIYLLIPAFSGLLWLTAAQPSGWRAFTVGWWFGAGFFGAGLYWVSFALLVDAEKFAWLMPFAVFGFAFGLGLFCAAMALLVHRTPGGLAPQALALAGAWTVLEWMRTWFLTGFPWNPVGSVWLFSDTLVQGASVVGTLGLSFIAVLAASAPAALIGRDRAGLLVAGLAGALIVALGAGGAVRLANATDAVVADVRLRLVQANIPQAQKWQADLRSAHMATQLDLSSAPPLAGDPPPTHVIWAETMAPFFLASHAQWLRLVGATAPPGGLMIIGAPRVVSDHDPDGLKVANALLAIDSAGAVRAIYDKFHLVPFGEYVPLSDWLPLERITQGLGAFTPGPGPQTLDLPGLPPVSPLICYEIIFPGQVTDGTGRAQWLLNLTNDGWYGKTAGPHQHFASTRLRAIEQGLPVVRVAGTGISAIVDAYGRVRERLSLNVKGFVDGDLPQPATQPAIYASSGDAPALLFAVLAMIVGVVWGRARAARLRAANHG